MEEKKIIKEIKKTYNQIKSNNSINAFYVNMGFIKCLFQAKLIDDILFHDMLGFNRDYYDILNK